MSLVLRTEFADAHTHKCLYIRTPVPQGGCGSLYTINVKGNRRVQSYVCVSIACNATRTELAVLMIASASAGGTHRQRALLRQAFPPHHTTKQMHNSATGTRTRVARVRAEYPNQLDYSGDDDLGKHFVLSGQLRSFGTTDASTSLIIHNLCP